MKAEDSSPQNLASSLCLRGRSLSPHFRKNPFTVEGQRYWISTCVKDYVKAPHLTNISNLERKTSSRESNQRESPSRFDMYKKLRWVTFGYHHCWDTKVYSYDNKCDFPRDLKELTQYMAKVLGFIHFEPEAAIVNYYHLDSTLSGHQDRSEETTDAPLFSISFGQAAIFLIGGETKTVNPAAIYLKSGDVVVMAGNSRKSFHGVPKILKTGYTPWIVEKPDSRRTFETLDFDCEPIPKKSKLEIPTNTSCIHTPETQDTNDPSFWENFIDEYASRCRINLNVRQVFASSKS